MHEVEADLNKSMSYFEVEDNESLEPKAHKPSALMQIGWLKVFMLVTLSEMGD